MNRLTHTKTHRRAFLRGVGTCLSLPFLEYFAAPAWAASARKRMVYVYLPNGARWKPSQLGTNFTLEHPLSALAPVRDAITVVSGLQLGPARASINGDHARALPAYLSGQTPQFPGPNVSPTLDLTLAKTLSAGSRFSNLCLAGEQHANSESGYTADYQACLSWLGGASPNPRDVDPAVVFDRLFGGNLPADRNGQRDVRLATGKSILDAVQGEAQALSKALGAQDRQRLDEYLQSVRELETRMNTPPPMSAATCPTGTRPAAQLPYEQRIGVFYDLMYHALSCGMTQVISFILASESTNQSYEFIGLPQSHHEISHDPSPNGYANIAKIVAWHIGQFANFCQKLKATADGDSNLLDNSIILMGGGLGDGARHTHDELPILIAGKGGGSIRGGQHLNFEGKPLCNLHLTLAQSLGVTMNQFGDSNGTLNLRGS